eukprot:scaffold28204_cov65-Phaeocystis_antarctica.AAC.7
MYAQRAELTEQPARVFAAVHLHAVDGEEVVAGHEDLGGDTVGLHRRDRARVIACQREAELAAGVRSEQVYCHADPA